MHNREGFTRSGDEEKKFIKYLIQNTTKKHYEIHFKVDDIYSAPEGSRCSATRSEIASDVDVRVDTMIPSRISLITKI